MLNHEGFPNATYPLLRNPPIQCAQMANSEACLYLECTVAYFGEANDLSARYARRCTQPNTNSKSAWSQIVNLVETLMNMPRCLRAVKNPI